ncbi:HTH-type transcriptional repressor RghR [Oxobacter pfennigii]|uniref:HTH-type transcriptional repressor RghR n=1 Tax=Oxobacter pfennigii TaxID=36849 RepID=A0A0P8WZE9_9CLOT|nr:transcriptional regulator [Oxobacter pfennigii]KPU43853.1 HTH-type transcriptional repressor RghR [Oxobacter pfennigii]
MDSIVFGKFLRGLRESKDISIRQLSMQSGVSSSYISLLENGKRSIPKPDILEKLAPCLSIDYEDFMEKAGYIDEKKGEPLVLSHFKIHMDKEDIEISLIDIMNYIEKNQNLTIGGHKLSEESRRLLMQAIEIGLKNAKEIAARRYKTNRNKRKVKP